MHLTSPALTRSSSFDRDMRNPALATASSRMLASTLVTRSVFGCRTLKVSSAMCRVVTGTDRTCVKRQLRLGPGAQCGPGPVSEPRAASGSLTRDLLVLVLGEMLGPSVGIRCCVNVSKHKGILRSSCRPDNPWPVVRRQSAHLR